MPESGQEKRLYVCVASGRTFNSVRLAHDYIEGRFSHGDDEIFEIDGRRLSLKEIVEQDDLVLDILKKGNPSSVTDSASIGNTFSLAKEIDRLSKRLAELEPAYRQLTVKIGGVESLNQNLTLVVRRVLEQLSTVRAELHSLGADKKNVRQDGTVVVSLSRVAQQIAVLEKMIQESQKAPGDLDARFADRVQRIDFLDQMYKQLGDTRQKFQQEIKRDRDAFARDEASALKSLRKWRKDALVEVEKRLRRFIDLQAASGFFRERVEACLSFKVGVYSQLGVPTFDEYRKISIRRLFSRETFKDEWASGYKWGRNFMRGMMAVVRSRGCVAPNEILALLKVGRSGILVTHYHYVTFSPAGCAMYLLNSENQLTVDEKIEGKDLSIILTILFGVPLLVLNLFCFSFFLFLFSLVVGVFVWVFIWRVFTQLGQTRTIFRNGFPILRIPARCDLGELTQFCEALSNLCAIGNLDVNELAKMPRIQIQGTTV